MKTTVYIRRSAESTENTVSLTQQRAAIGDYIAKQGWAPGPVVEDDGVSGGDSARFERIDAALKSSGSKSLVVFHIDRLGRDTAGTLHWLREWARRGIEIHAVGAGLIEIKTSSGLITVGVQALIAEHYKCLVGEKTAGALEILKKSGRRYSGQAPFGYRHKAGKLVESEEEQNAIRRAKALRSEGLGYRAIGRRLRDEGYRGRNGNILRGQTIKRVVAA